MTQHAAWPEQHSSPEQRKWWTHAVDTRGTGTERHTLAYSCACILHGGCRRKALLHHFSFKGAVSVAKFSPDGQYIAAGVGRLVQVSASLVPHIPGSGKLPSCAPVDVSGPLPHMPWELHGET